MRLQRKARDLVEKIQSFDLRQPWEDQIAGYETCLMFLQGLQHDQYASFRSGTSGESRDDGHVESATPSSQDAADAADSSHGGASAETPSDAGRSPAPSGKSGRHTRKRRGVPGFGRRRRGRDVDSSIRPFLTSKILPRQLPLDTGRIDWNQDCLSLFTHDIQEHSTKIRQEDAAGEEESDGVDGDSESDEESKESQSKEHPTAKPRWRRIPAGASNCSLIVKKFRELTRGLRPSRNDPPPASTGSGSSSAEGPHPDAGGAAGVPGVQSEGDSEERRARDTREQLDERLLAFVRPFPDGRDTSGDSAVWLTSGVSVPAKKTAEQNDISQFFEAEGQLVDMPSWSETDIERDRARASARVDPDDAALHHLWRRQELSLLSPAEETQLSALQEVYRRKKKREKIAAQRSRLTRGIRRFNRKRKRDERSEKDVPDPVRGVLGIEVTPASLPRRRHVSLDYVVPPEARRATKKAKLNDGSTAVRRTGV